MYSRIFVMILFFFIPAAGQAKISADHKAGAVVIGPTGLDCDPAMEGGLRWNSASTTHEMCDGIEWTKIRSGAATGVLSPPVPGTGYFVLRSVQTNADYNGTGGSMTTQCLNDLTSNDWLNKSDAVARGLLVTAKVKGFACSTSACNNLQPDTVYTFAVSGQPTRGGAIFVTDALGRGPGNPQNWTGTNYFGMEAFYWTNRENSGDDDYWGLNPYSTANGTSCYGINNAGSSTAVVGVSNKADAGRWNSVPRGCGSFAHLICFVDP